jgi:hypothetical protein
MMDDRFKRNVMAKISSYTVLIVLLTIGCVWAEKLEITALGFYQFGGGVDETTQAEGVFDYGEALGFSGAGGFGFIVDYRLGRRTLLEISWDQQSSALNHHQPDSATDAVSVMPIADLDVQYFQLGLIYDWSNSTTRPFIGGAVGMVRMDPSGAYRTESSPAFSAIVGVKSLVNRTVAFRMHFRLAISQMPEGSLFLDEYDHHKETFSPQFHLGVGLGVSL